MNRLSLEEAEELLKKRISKLVDTEEVSLGEACDRIAGEDIKALYPVPSFRRSAMDGYAVCADDICSATKENPVILPVKGKIYAGDKPVLQKEAHTAVRVMTGGYVPDGYDAVIRQEDTDGGEEAVKIFCAVKKEMNICPVGENLQKDQILAKKGSRIGRAEIGSLASAGFASVKVLRKPRVSLLSTGTELISPGAPLPDGKIYASITPMLLPSLVKLGFEVTLMRMVSDDPEEIVRLIEKAARVSDLVITTGGVSVGERDYLHAVLDSLGAEKLFYRVQIQPGTPTICAKLLDTLVLCLSGNPFAALANFDYYLPVIVCGLTGDATALNRRCREKLLEGYEKPLKQKRLVRARLTKEGICFPEKVNASSVTGNLSSCNGYAVLEPGDGCPAGTEVAFIPFC